MTAYLLDTNHVSALLDGVSVMRDRGVAADPNDLFGIAIPIFFRGRHTHRKLAHRRRGMNPGESYELRITYLEVNP